jgi:hypothetical protein
MLSGYPRWAYRPSGRSPPDPEEISESHSDVRDRESQRSGPCAAQPDSSWDRDGIVPNPFIPYSALSGGTSPAHGTASGEIANRLAEPYLALSAEGEGFEPSTRLNDV